MGSAERPVLLYDGDCGFCRFWVRRAQVEVGDDVTFRPNQQARGDYPNISEEAFERSVQLVEPGGAVFESAEAVLRVLAYAPGRGLGLKLYRSMPGVRTILEAGYPSSPRVGPGFPGSHACSMVGSQILRAIKRPLLSL